jgi:hypothetical protein
MVFTVNLKGQRSSTQGDLLGLWSFLQQLVGKPFVFLRPTYGDELTLHLGARLPPLSPKVTEPRGSYVLTLRGSDWWLLCGTKGKLTLSAHEQVAQPQAAPEVTGQELAKFPSIAAGALVVQADPFSDPGGGGFGLLLTFSDGSTVLVRPSTDEAPEPGGEALAGISDWELFTPYARYLRVGPGPQWAYEPSGEMATSGNDEEPQPVPQSS